MVHQKFQFQLFLLLIITKICACDVGLIKCEMKDFSRKCTISKLTVTSKNYTFTPVAPDSNYVINFQIVLSRIHVLTSNICTTLPKIKCFTATEQHIERVEDYAFNNCTDVTEINLERNNIHKLGAGIFSNTKKLEKLYILGGLMDRADINLFSNLKELKILMFGAIGLRELPIVAMENLKNLELLYINSNNLDDLDAQGLVEILPKLKTIYLNDNNFHCERLIEIVDIFKASSIETPDFLFEDIIKRRDYIPSKIHNIICVSQSQQETEKLKRALTDSLYNLKNLPIGKAVIQLHELVSSGFNDSDSAIVALSNELNVKSGNLSEQVFNLNETLQTNLLENTDSVNELRNSIKTTRTELDQMMKDNLAMQRKLGQNLKDNTAAQEQLEHKLNINLAVQQQFDQKLKDIVESYKKYDESIASLKLLETSLDEIKNGNCCRIYESFGNNMIEVWVGIIILIVVDVAIVTTGLCFIRKFRNIQALADRDSQILINDTSM